ncbi:phage tail protein [Glutamicibacter halophytocola]|uniref:phage tail protein n=1 Tax=Glutamicibacter halophytocola TaxID=1933880 RepID=UPI0015C5718C|nr:hypothetical protein [Glutamicibacter halophytocola]NQD40913.1 hypothetical protein [Glutamicibacter halophytocola]
MAKSAILSVKVIADAKNAVSGMKSASSAVGGFLKVAGGVAIAYAGKKLLDYGINAVKMAGDVQQSVGAIDTVFKDNAKEMHAWADGAAQTVGLTKNEYNELGTLIGTQLKNGGTAMDQLAPKTNQLIGLGADLSSMFGGTSKEAVEALSSALKGERDPIEKYGVSLNQAKIDAEAAALGFTKVGGSLSTEASQAATLSLIMKQTADAHGNFAKESNTLQGQQQRAAASWDNISAKIGGIFLPVITSVFGFINANVLPVIDQLVTNLGEGGGLSGAFQKISDVAGPIIGILGQIFAPLIPQVIELVQNVSPLGILFQALLPIMPMLGDLFFKLAGTLSSLLQAVIPIVQTIAGALIPLITQLAAAVLPPLITVFSQIVTAIVPVVNMLGPVLTTVIKALMPVVKVVFGIIQTVITTVLKVISGVISAFSAALRGDWSSFWDSIAQIAKDIWNGITSVAKQFFGDLPGAILGALGDLGGLLLDAGRAVIDGFLGALRGAWDKGKEFISGIGGWIADHKGPISYDKKLLKPAGSAIMGGLISSMKASMPALRRTLKDVTGEIGGLESNPEVNLTARGRSSSGTAGRAVIVNVTFNGLVTDKVGTAREIRKVLSDYDRLVGA